MPDLFFIIALIIVTGLILGLSFWVWWLGPIPIIGLAPISGLILMAGITSFLGPASDGVWFPMIIIIIVASWVVMICTVFGEDTIFTGYTLVIPNVLMAIIAIVIACLSLAGFTLLEMPIIFAIILFFVFIGYMIPFIGSIIAIIQLIVILIDPAWIQAIAWGAPMDNIAMSVIALLIVATVLNTLLSLRIYNLLSWVRMANPIVYVIIIIIYTVMLLLDILGGVIIFSVIGVALTIGIVRKGDLLPGKIVKLKDRKICLLNLQECDFSEATKRSRKN